MAFFSFGKKKKRSVRSKHKVARKPPAALLKKCRKHHIKTTMKRGGRRVYRKVSILKKLLAKKMRKIKKMRKHRKVSKRKVHRRGMEFGSLRKSRKSRFGEEGSLFSNPANFGYNQPVQQYPQTLSQSSMVSNEKMNPSRPEGMGLPPDQLPVYGVYRDFFGQDVPTQIPANYNFMGQPDGTLYPVGAPFQRYTTPVSFGKKKRYNVTGSPCNRLKKKVCRSNPNCSYTKQGCRRRSGTKSRELVYEGPSLAYGRRRS